MAKPPLGSGERFKQLVAKLRRRKGVQSPERLAAWIGMQKYGKEKMLQLARRARKNKK